VNPVPWSGRRFARHLGTLSCSLCWWRLATADSGSGNHGAGGRRCGPAPPAAAEQNSIPRRRKRRGQGRRTDRGAAAIICGPAPCPWLDKKVVGQAMASRMPG